jgi:hypothetical protein
MQLKCSARDVSSFAASCRKSAANSATRLANMTIVAVPVWLCIPSVVTTTLVRSDPASRVRAAEI